MDTLAFRLRPRLRLAKAYRKFLKEERKWKRRQFEKKGFDNPLGTPLLGFERLQAGIDIGERGYGRISAILDANMYSFGLLPEKLFYVASSVIKGVMALFFSIVSIALLGKWIEPTRASDGLHKHFGKFLSNSDTDAIDSMADVVLNPTFQTVFLVILLFWMFKMRRRLKDVSEPHSPPRRAPWPTPKFSTS